MNRGEKLMIKALEKEFIRLEKKSVQATKKAYEATHHIGDEFQAITKEFNALLKERLPTKIMLAKIEILRKRERIALSIVKKDIIKIFDIESEALMDLHAMGNTLALLKFRLNRHG